MSLLSVESVETVGLDVEAIDGRLRMRGPRLSGCSDPSAVTTVVDKSTAQAS
jgi:hypothetical protein